MKEIIIASRNVGKVNEIKSILIDLPIFINSCSEYPNLPEVIEDGKSLEENTLKKARSIYLITGKPALADDTALEVYNLGMRPGIHSARYAGVDVSYEKNNLKLLKELKGVPSDQRGARFRCVAAFCADKFEKITEGICTGQILESPRGVGGFGYDPLFIPDGFTETFAELPPKVKNTISHRAKAFQLMKEIIIEYLDIGDKF